ncbi:hypothetical protein CC85DRAFT_288872 [Cutaneotrichosporon oleaginosum]|uniref:Uncharacterized protein n=1 Tax=Cutaneotrichosporon oleaginosum TaxID=879819 RepID=A0A0J0XDF2_9TREE|nr:uncharacterized protein CC85DRAFT_288872 [Cutaneotrichosporon oleaginosum]KLT39097.1 hypothetical protein CC85DRAFT_288872 [Cutaneotrichosporon oleaginosum]TXT10439.1 hypothetical protein COLE_04373 [Cutaneotrichosporon oleaginosum]
MGIVEQREEIDLVMLVNMVLAVVTKVIHRLHYQWCLHLVIWVLLILGPFAIRS